jgi:hypothetical protein
MAGFEWNLARRIRQLIKPDMCCEILRPKFEFKKVIYGCDARGDGESAYMTRYTFLQTDWLKLCIHVFHRSDADDLHDHPWSFLTMILWRGYFDITAKGRENLRFGWMRFRKAEHQHRVELREGKKAVTLVVMFRRRRNWGFLTPSGWTIWTEYFRKSGC